MVGHSGSNSESGAKLGELNENSESDDNHDVGELSEISNDSDREFEEAISNEDDDYGYNHNRLVHGNKDWDSGMGENDEDDDWESMYMD